MPRPLLLFAPGAGAPTSSAWIQQYRAGLAQRFEVVCFDYDYQLKGSRRPDPLPRLVERHCLALAEAQRQYPGPTFLIGKSMGGRIGCHLANSGKEFTRPLSGLICLGYPLQSTGIRKTLRDVVLKELQLPTLFVQGTRDKLCPPELLERVLPQIPAVTTVKLIEGGDHSFKRTQKQTRESGLDEDALFGQIVDCIGEFVGSCVAQKA